MPTALSENDNQGTDDSSASSWSQNQNPTGDEKSIPDYSEVLIPVIGMAAIIATISFVPRIKKRDDEGERP